MPITYVFQDSFTLTRISPDLIQTAAMDDPIFDIFPLRPRNAAKLRWAIKDKYTGLMGLRGLGGEPSRVNRVGEKVYESDPGAYGEFETVDETEMTNRGAGFPAGMDIPIDIRDLVSDAQYHLTVRQVSRMKQVAWALALSQTITVLLPGGGVGWQESYTGQTLTPATPWSTLATSTPLADLRSLQPTYGFGTSNKFNSQARLIMNSVTKNYLLGNTNAADLGGKRVENGATINDLPGINRILVAQDLPPIEVWDDGYIDDAGAFQLYIPNGRALVVGARPTGETPGEFQLTRNMNNPNGEPAPYAFVDDRTKGDKKSVPPRIDVHQGFNGGPVVERPSQLVTLVVG
ncbi:hypothetical protein [Armatimonas rosea]|uniref:Major capsid protein E n=1 Tax=Armatimonas rosea TaxID=685828 RepID=A0A7W9WA59_ARMRO|nr:hypothetical protein [Armatimonas rosea]MBB6053267.1 hypothetical protein [Armatimonas rosea]